MASAQLSASIRNDTGKGAARTLRSNGQIPAVIYGHGRDPQALAINSRELDRLLERISAESTVIELSLDGRSSRTLIREIQRHPFKRQILHVDFQELVAGEKVTVRLPIVLTGTPEGVRVDGGMLDQTMREIEIKADPANLPDHLEIDVSPLRIGQSIHVADVQLPQGVELVSDADASVCVVAAPVAAVAETTTPETTDETAEPEVIGKAKKEDEEEE